MITITFRLTGTDCFSGEYFQSALHSSTLIKCFSRVQPSSEHNCEKAASSFSMKLSQMVNAFAITTYLSSKDLLSTAALLTPSKIFWSLYMGEFFLLLLMTCYRHMFQIVIQTIGFIYFDI